MARINLKRAAKGISTAEQQLDEFIALAEKKMKEIVIPVGDDVIAVHQHMHKIGHGTINFLKQLAGKPAMALEDVAMFKAHTPDYLKPVYPLDISRGVL